MITNSKNKDMASSEETTTKVVLQEFHFAGGGEYYPMTILAANIFEAEKIYITKRIIINNLK